MFTENDRQTGLPTPKCMHKRFLIEAVVDSLDAALAAEAAGADRLELCSGLETGGLTPGAGLMSRVFESVEIPVFVLLRPHGGDFLLSEAAFETLLLEAEYARELGAAGIVAGILRADGQIDVPRMQLLVEAAAPLPVTFHRAFDRIVDRVAGLEALLQTGCNRLLSSGLAASALEGAGNLAWLRAQAGQRLTVMPGGGVTAANAAQLAEATGAVEFHLSAIRQIPGRMAFQPAWQGAQPPTWVPAPEKVAAIKQVLMEYFNQKI